jgi:D-beta-D-heptose 7-phosphate kinase/D-beta-D-heptose 1-phosphate adenosyltransferase
MTTVFINGTFDILLPGHVGLLNTARAHGDYLVVAIDSDRRVRELKGSTRPVNNETVRRIMLSNLKAVDLVEVFDTDEELMNIIKTYSPSIMFKGSDWKGQSIIGGHLVNHIEYFDRIDDYSTTNTIQNIIDRR